ncbi:glycosyltransferase family 4 protein [Mariniflexile litorale]|uniref:Glycosyltransferase family 4 protein n=1 Tax=Mariniflexile litorale TaxID=3045158 RepID=A0AAU7EDU2_9FLAO|nr:glycosyltransferase family 4 protein [Mariniflexile sp. KMM 9835]MDQ8212198.1 glycosyltransferase family 4 protein [Mariniflexile sp. KMM 9835]
MKVLQLIDSLEVGGAERVAVNIANALSTKIEGSYLCATRVEGLLKDSLDESVNFLFLNKNRTFDIKAILKFSKYIKEEGIDIIHAHSSSFFLATTIRVFNRNIKVVWHDHYGNSEFLQNRKFKILRICSSYFNHIFTVNKALEQWAIENLKTNSVSYLPNFAVINNEVRETILDGEEEKRIICLANLREQKDHLTLLKAFKKVIEKHSDWSLHLVGKDFADTYSKMIKTYILDENLNHHVFVYATKSDTLHILSQSTIGVLASKSEGLPLALLEYGLAKLPVIATRVGECLEVIKNNYNGVLVRSENPEELSKTLIEYIENKELRDKYAFRYHEHIQSNYTEAAQIKTILKVYNNICH